MKAYLLIVIFICCVCKYTSVDTIPELKRNILNFGYGINFKYEEILSHSFDRFYVVTKFVLLKFSPIEFDSKCSYLDIDINRSKFLTWYIPNIRNFCKKIVPFIYFYKEEIDYYNQTAHEMLTNEISLILPMFPKERKEKRTIITLLVTSLISLPYEGISSYLHYRRQKALHKAFVAMENKVNLQKTVFHLEDLVVMYGIYNSETLEQLIDTVHKMHDKTTWNEKLFAS